MLDGIVVTAPTIQATHFGGKTQISGVFVTESEVVALVTLLKFGERPNAIEEVSFARC